MCYFYVMFNLSSMIHRAAEFAIDADGGALATPREDICHVGEKCDHKVQFHQCHINTFMLFSIVEAYLLELLTSTVQEFLIDQPGVQEITRPIRDPRLKHLNFIEPSAHLRAQLLAYWQRQMGEEDCELYLESVIEERGMQVAQDNNKVTLYPTPYGHLRDTFPFASSII